MWAGRTVLGGWKTPARAAAVWLHAQHTPNTCCASLARHHGCLTRDWRRCVSSVRACFWRTFGAAASHIKLLCIQAIKHMSHFFAAPHMLGGLQFSLSCALKVTWQLIS